LQNAIEKRCIPCRWCLVCQFLAAWQRSMPGLARPAAFTCPAAIGGRPRFATGGYVSLGRSQHVVQHPGRHWRFIATADSQRFAANGAGSPNVSAAGYPCLAAIGDRKRFAATGQRRFAANGDRRRSTATSHSQKVAATG
jgi:hypothetical protein